MKTIFGLVLALHGLLHLLGFAKAFGFAKIERLTCRMDRPTGAVWLAAALAFVAAAALLFLSPRFWWVAAAPGVVLSQMAIARCWSDAKFGSLVNFVILVPLSLSLLDLRPSSYRAMYVHEVERAIARSRAEPTLVTDEDLAALPPVLQTYLRRVGVVGRPHVYDFRARFGGQMRMKRDGGWLEIRADQHEFFDEPARMFWIRSSLYGIPFEGLHLYVGPSATMQVRIASLVDIVDARGPEMNRSETVTLFNDMCLLAPASLIDADVTWQATGHRTVVGAFTNAGNTVRAELTFDTGGDLVGFVSNDRYLSGDGKTYRNLPWSTPVGEYRDFGGVRLASRGEATWQEPDGDFVYARFVLESIVYNLGTGSKTRVLALH